MNEFIKERALEILKEKFPDNYIHSIQNPFGYIQNLLLEKIELELINEEFQKRKDACEYLQQKVEIAIERFDKLEKKYKAIIEAIPDIMFIMDKDGIYKDYQTVDPKKLFKPPDEFLGKTVVEILPPELGSQFLNAIQTVIDTHQPLSIDYSLHISNQTMYFEGRIFPYIDNQSLVIIRDVTDRKLVEEELKKYKEHLEELVAERTKEIIEEKEKSQTLFETITNGIVYIDTNGNFISANSAALNMIGITQEELKKYNIMNPSWKIIKEDGSDFPLKERPAVVTLKTGKIVRNVILGLYNPTFNEYHWFNVSTIPLFHSGEAKPYMVYSSFNDITETMKAAESLKITSQAIEATTNGILITDPTKSDNPIIYVNSAYEKITGYSKEETIGTNCRFLSKDDKQQDVLQELKIALEKGEAFKGLLRNYKKDGTLFWNELSISPVKDSSGKIKYFIGIQNDVTDRVKAQEKLVESEARLQLAISAASIGLWEFSYTEQNMVYISEAWKKQMGYSDADLNLPFDEFIKIAVHPDDFDSVKLKVTNYIFSGEVNFEYEFRAIHKKGHILWLLARMHIIKDKNGQPIRMIGANIDITEQKQVEVTLSNRVLERTKELARINEELRIARDLAESASHAKSSFLANMSHELRTPLNAIIGYSQMYLEASNMTAKQLQGISTIYSSGKHLLSLISDILDFSKIEANKFELNPSEIFIIDLLNEILSMIEIRVYKKKLVFVSKIDENIPACVVADEKVLKQILLNLLGNAVKFTLKGEITFIVSYMPIKNKEVGIFEFHIQDTGIGISEEDLKVIFEPFKQVSKNKNFSDIEGTGLGLTITQRLIKLMNSELQVKSQKDVGSSFWFQLELPVLRSIKGDLYEKIHTRLVGYKGNKKTILIIDDNAANRNLLVDLLHPLGFLVLEAQNGKEGFVIYKKEKLDCIFMDMIMTEMDGIECTKKIREYEKQQDSPKIPIIALSANISEVSKEKAIQAGCNDFLKKPVELRQILALLDKNCNIEWIESSHNDASWINTQENEIKIYKLLAEIPERYKVQLIFYAETGDTKEYIKELEIMDEVLDKKFLPVISRLKTLASDFNNEAILEMFREKGYDNEEYTI